MVRALFLLGWLLGLGGVAWAEAVAVFSPTGPDAAAYGEAEGYPLRVLGVPREQHHLVAEFSRAAELSRVNTVRRAEVPFLFSRAAQELRLHYSYRGRTYGLDEYMARHPATGLLILQDRTILFEHYQYGRTDTHRFVSQSMAKTVTAMLAGIAVGDGRIRSIDDPASAYVRGLGGSAIGESPVRALLHMASGLAYREVYDGNDDAARLGRALFTPRTQGAVMAVRQFETRETAPMQRWHYKGVDTETLGLVVQEATGMSLAGMLSERIWRRIGTEADAGWGTDGRGVEAAFCCLSAVLRDWGRLGRLLAHDGAWDGTQLIPAEWVRAATTVQAPFLAPGLGGTGSYYGYGYQVWLLPEARRQFVLLGIHGQALYVDPESKLVMVHTAVRPKPSGDPMAPELGAVWRALVAAKGK